MNLFKGLMFLDGHFTRPEDIDDDFAPLGNRAASARRRAGGDAPAAPKEPEAAPTPEFGVMQNLLFLGGRPMHAGHNLDVEEPFEQLAAANDARHACVDAACG